MKRNLITFVILLSFILLTNFNFAFAQADKGIRDTCRVDREKKVVPNSTVVLNVYAINDSALQGFAIPLAFPDSMTNLDVNCDSVSFVGTRTTTAAYYGATVQNNKNRLVIYAAWGTQLDPGNGPVAKLYFSTGATWDSTMAVKVDSCFFPPGSSLEFSNIDGAGFTPEFAKGALEVREVSTPTKPTVFSLSQNYPNPFNPTTVIRFSLPKDSWVKVEIYNILGQKVKTLVDEKLTAGIKEVTWDGRSDNGSEVGSGVYFYKIKADNFSDLKKMVMLK